jgi:hypothetical protein
LAINLDVLSSVLKKAQHRTDSAEGESRYSEAGCESPPCRQVLGNFLATLNSCECLLKNEKHFQKYDGCISNIYWYEQIESEVKRLNDQLASHNIKASYRLQLASTYRGVEATTNIC